jgi:superfamily II DNA or RNA helicase
MPPLNVDPLWDAQIEAIPNTEQSLRENRRRALIQMATGSGKTYTAATLPYRLSSTPIPHAAVSHRALAPGVGARWLPLGSQ